MASNFSVIDYTSADTEIRKGAEKIMGVKPSKTTGRKSVEIDNINRVSPTAKKKKNKWGV